MYLALGVAFPAGMNRAASQHGGLAFLVERPWKGRSRLAVACPFSPVRMPGMTVGPWALGRKPELRVSLTVVGVFR